MKEFILILCLRCLTVLLFILPTFTVTSQSLHGKVQDVDGRSMPFVNLLLLRAQDSTLVKGAVTDTAGLYMIDNIKPGNYVLSASIVGHKKTFVPGGVRVGSETTVEVPAISLAPQVTQLKEVAITAQRPFVEQYLDRTVINVANSIVGSGSTALEVLEKSPGVTVDRQNDQIQLRGQTGVIVQIDGKQTYLAMADVVAMLRGTTSENIDKIELITNPSSKYDAAGNSGIINIVTKKNNNMGTNGVITLAGGSGRYDRERAGIQLSNRTKKANLFVNYSANRGGNFFNLDTHRQFIGGESTNVAEQDTYLRLRDFGHNAKAGLDYKLGKNTSVGLTWTGFWSERVEKGTASSIFRKAVEQQAYLEAYTDKDLSNRLTNQVANVNMQHKFRGKGGQLSADVDFGYFDRHFMNLLTTSTSVINDETVVRILFTQIPTNIWIQTYKADYNREISRNWKLETGLKFSNVKTDNDLSISKGAPGDIRPDEALASHFQYTEQITAGYISFFGKLKGKTEVQIGLRTEQTHSLANSVTSSYSVPRDYLNFFPTLFVSQPMSKDHTLILSYSRRIERPNYQDLSTGRSYIDPYLYSEGNAFLKPQYTNSFEIKHGFQNTIFTSFGASFTDEAMSTFVEPVDSIQSVRRPLNMGKTQFYELSLNFPVTIAKGWTLQASFLGTYSRFQYFFQDLPQRGEQFSGRVDISNSIALGRGWTAEVSGWVTTPKAYAIYTSPWLGSLDAGIQKTINARVKLKLTAQDIFHTNFVRSNISAPGFARQTRLNFDTRVVMLNLTYSFGNQKLKGIRQRNTGSEDELRRTKS